MSWRKIRAEFDAVGREIIRIHRLATSGRLSEVTRDALYSLPRTDGRGSLLIGRKGAEALSRVAQTALRSDPFLRKRVGAAVVRREIERRYARHICSGHEIDDAVAQKIVTNTLECVRRKKIKTLTHILPCVLSHDTSEDSFLLGPVRFVTIAKLLREYDDKLKQHSTASKRRYKRQERERLRAKRPRLIGEEPPWPLIELERSSQLLEQEARAYLQTYKWAAVVRVPDFDLETSRQVARLCVETALNFLRLFIGAAHADDFRLGGGFRLEQKRVQLHEDEGGEISISWSRDAGDAVIDKDWVSKIFSGERGAWLRAGGTLIPWLQAVDEVPLIYRRLLDALWWYGEAVSEPLAHAKVIRYCAALEAFLGTRPDDVAHQIALRTAYLCSDDALVEGLGLYREVKRLYSVRSALVHGGLSPSHSRVVPAVYLGERICRDVLIEGLAWTMWLAHQDWKMDLRQLDQHFEHSLPVFSYGLYGNPTAGP